MQSSELANFLRRNSCRVLRPLELGEGKWCVELEKRGGEKVYKIGKKKWFVELKRGKIGNKIGKFEMVFGIG